MGTAQEFADTPEILVVTPQILADTPGNLVGTPPKLAGTLKQLVGTCGSILIPLLMSSSPDVCVIESILAEPLYKDS